MEVYFLVQAAFDLGFDAAGFDCRWQVEIDRQAQSVLRHRWPNTPKHPDVCGVGKHNLEPVDCIIGGSPCQGFSVAGRRDGVEDHRSKLFAEMARVVDELRPRYVVWENVPGVFSGFDQPQTAKEVKQYERSLFDWAKRGDLELRLGGPVRRWWLGAVLRTFTNLGYGGAYRVLDAQFFGVPQRRRRIFAVFCRDAGRRSRSECAAEILALSEGVRGDSQAGRKEGEGFADRLAPCLRGSGVGGERVGGERVGDSRGQDCVIPVKYSVPTLSPCLKARDAKGPSSDGDGDGDGDGAPLVAYQCQGSNVGEMGTLRSGNGNSSGGVPFLAFSAKDHGADAGELCPTLRSMGHDKSHANGGGQVAVAYRTSGNCGAWETGEKTDALTTGTDPNATIITQPQAFQTRIARNGRGQPKDTVDALTSSEGGSHADSKPHVFGAGHGVRRLTPTEQERLMAWPDSHTKYGINDKGVLVEIADGPRYRMTGNGVVSNVAHWLALRMAAVDARESQ